MKKSSIIIVLLAALAVILLWGVSVNNRLVTEEENVQKAWSQVENVYRRRMDLIPQLVNTVKGAADFERKTLTEVINARANADKVTVDLNHPYAGLDLNFKGEILENRPATAKEMEQLARMLSGEGCGGCGGGDSGVHTGVPAGPGGSRSDSGGDRGIDRPPI